MILQIPPGVTEHPGLPPSRTAALPDTQSEPNTERHTMTNTIIDAIAGFFTEDPDAFEGYTFAELIAQGADAATIGRSALQLAEDEAELFSRKMNAPRTPDEWGFSHLMLEIIQAFPAEWHAELGGKLIAAYAPGN